jgi:hypothetical protein
MSQEVVRRILVAAGSAVWLSACGGRSAGPASATSPVPVEPDGPVQIRGDESAAADVGMEGGTLELASGARLEVPRGAFRAAERVNMASAQPTGAFNVDTDQPVGPAFVIQPDVESEAGPFVLSVPFSAVPPGYEPSEVAIAIEEPSDSQRALVGSVQTRWNLYPAAIEGSRLRATTPVLPGFRFQFVFAH